MTGYLHGVGRRMAKPDSGTAEEPYRRTRVLRDAASGQFLGIAAAEVMPVHPQRIRTHIEIAEPFRRRGLGRAAVEHLRALTADDGRGLHSRGARGSAAHRFAAATGYREVQRSRGMRIRPREHYGSSGRFDVAEYRVGPGTEGSPAVPDECVRAYWNAYEATHALWDPVRPSTVEETRRNFFVSTPALFLAAFDRVTGCAAGTAFVDPPDLGAFDFADGTGFDGSSVDPFDLDAREAVQDLLLAAAQHSPDGELVAEVDDAYATLLAAVEPIIVRVEADLVISATDSRVRGGGTGHLH
ncbi:hypothetical protein BIV57_20495 [Mangrovactinospora gilvigrisea]|uniref:N-acetyltransferase domain-containing protein n=1 Tax=Mangrovactinospora gilvigrisea TaxID=1428644 RepID=A0A1J7C7L8_9ACTN|nr:hypothetical protein [Mangrovactinospora gilvigrisea]OIV35642.1 hypothetical protein BIV57_20495 [Mangrovactinospora gilvigrisea]